jgi:exosortase
MILAVVLLVVAACWPTVVDLNQRWTDDVMAEQTHGYLVACVSVFLLWRAGRSRLPQDAGSRWPVLLALLLAGAAWVFSVRAGIAVFQWVLFPPMLWLGGAVALGAAAARRYLFAFAYLYFAMPLWGLVNPLFQWSTVYVVRGLLRLFGVPAYFAGNTVQVPEGTFEIAGGCSGLNFAVVALALGALLGELRNDGLRGRVKLLLLAGLFAVLTNWVRVFSLIMVGHFTHMQHYLVARSHYGYGWVLFAIAMTGFFLIERRLALRDGAHAAVVPPLPQRVRPSPGAAIGVLQLAGVLAVITAVRLLSARPAEIAATQPPVAPGWPMVSATVSGWIPIVAAADLHIQGVFQSADGGQIQYHRFVFLDQRQGKELGGYSNDLLGGVRALSMTQATLGGIPLSLYEAGDNLPEWLIAAGFSAEGRHYDSPLAAQLRYAGGAMLRLRSAESSVELWRIPCMPDCASARSVLESFITATAHEN